VGHIIADISQIDMEFDNIHFQGGWGCKSCNQTTCILALDPKSLL